MRGIEAWRARSERPQQDIITPSDIVRDTPAVSPHPVAALRLKPAESKCGVASLVRTELQPNGEAAISFVGWDIPKAPAGLTRQGNMEFLPP